MTFLTTCQALEALVVESERARPRSGRASNPSLYRATGIPARGFQSCALLVEELADASIGSTFNQYREGPRAALLRVRLARYLAARAGADVLLVGEAAGYRGARVSGVPFTSERQLTGLGPAEATASIVHRVLAELGLEERVLLWNVVPTHPGTAASNRRPTRVEIAAGARFCESLAAGRTVVAVGRIAERVLGASYVRHPSHGGATEFRNGLIECLACGTPRPA